MYLYRGSTSEGICLNQDSSSAFSLLQPGAQDSFFSSFQSILYWDTHYLVIFIITVLSTCIPAAFCILHQMTYLLSDK